MGASPMPMVTESLDKCGMPRRADGALPKMCISCWLHDPKRVESESLKINSLR